MNAEKLIRPSVLVVRAGHIAGVSGSRLGGTQKWTKHKRSRREWSTWIINWTNNKRQAIQMNGNENDIRRTTLIYLYLLGPKFAFVWHCTQFDLGLFLDASHHECLLTECGLEWLNKSFWMTGPSRRPDWVLFITIFNVRDNFCMKSRCWLGHVDS